MSKLDEVLRVARKSEFYKHRIRDNFMEIPITKKEDFARYAPPRSTAMLTEKVEKCYIYESGGTTGSPAYSIYTFDEFDLSTRVLSDLLDPLIQADDIITNVLIPGNLWTAYYAFCKALERLNCVILPIGGGAPYATIIHAMKSFKANTLLGVPSYLVALANYAEKNGLEVRINKILYGGEFLSVHAENILRKVFHAKEIYSALYGPVESGPVASQCRSCKKNCHHIAWNHHLLEILDEKGEPIPNSSKDFGRIVITNLDRKLMPIIRFDTGDIGRWSSNCGELELFGRADERFKAGYVYLSYGKIEECVRSICEPVALQVVVSQEKGKDVVLVLIESGTPINTKKAREVLMDRIKDFKISIDKKLLKLKVRQVDVGMIQRAPRTGKIKKIVDKRQISTE